MTIYRGLNIAKGMVDVDNPRIALENLGLNREDFDLIAGLTQAGTDVTISDFHAVSGLTGDANKELQSLASTAERSGQIIDGMNDIRVPMDFNLSINNKLVGGAIKFDYLDFTQTDSDTYWVKKSADISTSRISSWSPVGVAPNTPDSYILYGGDLKVTGQTIAFTNLKTSVEPLPKTFRAEVATHVVKIQNTTAGGATNTHQFLAMKGIPLTWEAYFRDVDLKGTITSAVTDSVGDVPMTWRITNLDGSNISYNSGDNTIANPGNLGPGTLANPSVYSFRDTASKPRRLEFFYDPSRIDRLDIRYVNLLDWTNVSLDNIRYIDIEGNDLSVIPEFRSDATLAKAGFVGGAGLAPNLETLIMTGSDLSRGTNYLEGRPKPDGTTYSSTEAATAGLATSQVNRLPLSIKHVTFNGCFQDNTPIDMSDYLNLETFVMGAEYQRDLTRRQPQQLESPHMYDPLEARTGLQLFGTIFQATSGSDTVKLDFQEDPHNVWFDTSYGGSIDADTVYVRLDYRVIATNTSGAKSASGSSAIDDGTVFRLNRNPGNSTKKYTLKNQDGTATITLTATHISAMTGGFSLTRCDASGNDVYNDKGGIKTYKLYRQNYKGLSPSVYRSNNTVLVDVRQNDLMEGNSEFPHYDSSSTAGKTRSVEDMSIPAFRSNALTHFYMEHADTNAIDFSNKTNLRVLYHRHNDTDNRYQTAQKTWDGKIDGCNKLAYFNIYNFRRSAGNWKTNGMFQGKPDLYFIDTRWGWNFNGSHRDDILSGSEKVRWWLNAGNKSTTNDLFGTSGATGHTGQMFTNSPKLQYLYSYWNWIASGTLVHPTNSNYDLNLSNCTDLRVVYLANNDLRGTLPNFSANRKLRFLDVRRQKNTKDLRYAQGEQTYKIISKRSSSNNNGATTAVWVQAGWVAGPATDPVSGATHGSTPQVGDHFVATEVDVTNTQLISGYRYRIRSLGSTNNTQWGSIGASTSPYEGRVFTANGASTVPGNGKVFVYTLDRVRSRGFVGTFPTMDQEYLYTIRANANSFSGQFPKQNLRRLRTLWMHDCEYTGDIPDWSLCPELRFVKAQNNNLSTYTAGNMVDCDRITNVNLSGNKLRATVGTQLIYDLYENYLRRPRGGVSLNFLNQNAGSGIASLSENAILQDGTDGPNSSANKLAALRTNGWTILLD